MSPNKLAAIVGKKMGYLVEGMGDDTFCVELPPSCEEEFDPYAMIRFEAGSVVVFNPFVHAKEEVLLADPQFFPELRGALGRFMAISVWVHR